MLAVALVVLVAAVLIRVQAARQEAAAEAAYPPEGQFVDVDGVRVHLVQEGEGPDVVLLHGAGGSTRDFTYQFVDRIKDRYRVTVIDRPGLGYSDRLRDYGLFSRAAETPRDQARLLQAAAALVGVETPIVLGHSFGGAVALAWADRKSVV